MDRERGDTEGIQHSDPTSAKNSSSIKTLIPVAARAFVTSRHASWASIVAAAFSKLAVWTPPSITVGTAKGFER